MKLFLAALLFSMSASAASITITFTANDTAVTDIEAYLIKQSTSAAAVSVAMLATDTTMTVNAIPAGTTTTGTVLVDSEVIAYTGISGSQLTGLTRGTNVTNAANNTTAAAHSSGASVRFLTFPNTRSWIVFLVENGAKDAIQSLGTASALIGTNITNINTNTASENTSLAGAVQ